MKTVQVLWAAGFNKCAISRETGIPRSTVKSWLLDGVPAGNYRNAPEPVLADLPAAEYAYLLGMYLGDGHIARSERTYLLRVSCDAQYVEIMAELERAVRAVAPSRAVSRTSRPGRCIMVSAYWKHWPVVLPPGRFVRGLIHSDGCRYVARQPTPDGRCAYSYVRYSFSNRSTDIKQLFCEHLDLLGVEWTQANEFNIQIARRGSVEILEQIVGPKR